MISCLWVPHSNVAPELGAFHQVPFSDSLSSSGPARQKLPCHHVLPAPWQDPLEFPLVKNCHNFEKGNEKGFVFKSNWPGKWWKLNSTTTKLHLGVSENRGFPPKSSLLNKVFHYFHHPFLGCFPLFLETPICVSKGQIHPMPPSAPPLEQWWPWWDRNKPSLWPKSSQVQIHSCFLVLNAGRGSELRLVSWDIGMLVERNVTLLNI